MVPPRRKLRPMIITMGGDRQQQMEQIFNDPRMAQHFEFPVFSPGIPSRSLRNRNEFFRIAHKANLIPDGDEWEALRNAADNPYYQEHSDRFFDCLQEIPVTPGRRGSKEDIKIHYSCELWRKAKALNRGRAVLACSLAHLIALKEFVDKDMDVLFEDNIRLPVEDCAERIWEAVVASNEWCRRENIQCYFRYVGFLGSIPNLKWIYESHIQKTGFQRECNALEHSEYTVFPFPTTQDIEQDLANQELQSPVYETNLEPESMTDARNSDDRKPGGNSVWGCYGYWVSKTAYDAVLDVLRNDVGAMLWKGKRNRHYSVKPIDKVLPRQIMSLFGPNSVHIPTNPAVFRAPMLTSKIHTQWDPEFCKSTEYQLQQTGLSWSDLCLTSTEQAVVAHHETTGEWLTPKALEENV